MMEKDAEKRHRNQTRGFSENKMSACVGNPSTTTSGFRLKVSQDIVVRRQLVIG